MNPIETLRLDCPWCAAPIDIDVDLSAGNQNYVEDCQVCCAPIVVTVRLDEHPDAELLVTLARECD